MCCFVTIMCIYKLFLKTHTACVSGNDSETVEITSEDSIFVVPAKEIKRETAEEEFHVGMAVLEEMDESMLNKVPKSEPLDIIPKIEPEEEQPPTVAPRKFHEIEQPCKTSEITVQSSLKLRPSHVMIEHEYNCRICQSKHKEENRLYIHLVKCHFKVSSSNSHGKFLSNSLEMLEMLLKGSEKARQTSLPIQLP